MTSGFGRALLSLLLVAALPIAAHATEPVGEHDNACVYPDARDACQTADDCAGNDYAILCVQHIAGDPSSRRCEIPCEQGEGVSVAASLQACAIGETCVEGRATPGRRAYYCEPSAFRVDLNLLDSCVRHHLNGLQPTFSENECSLESNLTQLLDQNGDSAFDIFDLDLCILAFLEQPGCDVETATCDAEDLVFCAADDDCGAGLYCDLGRNACQRDCGIIAAREPGMTELERQCSGNGKVCDFERGRCVDVDVTRSTCDVDNDCPAGAYCFLGRCAPRCYRSVDCPSNGWYCTPNNRCRAVPHPEADGGFVFDPQNYAIRFARDQLKLDPVGDRDRSAMVILDLLSKKVVVGNPSVTFGYRLEVSYGLKLDSRCLKPFIDCGDPDQRNGEREDVCRARQDDCYIDDTEQWVTLDSPFGTISAVGAGEIGIHLDTAAAERLSPGVYEATVRAIFDNGDSDSIRVSYTKTSPSGEYEGSLTVYQGSVDSPLNGTLPLSFGMRLQVYEDEPRVWNALMSEYHLASAVGGDTASFQDITSGYLVHGQLHSDSAFAFQKGGSLAADAEIPFVGLYSPDLGRLRVIGMIDIAADFCISEDGQCDDSDASQLKVKNPFGRAIRRQIEFIGPFDDATGRFHGIYREKISGLAADYDVTLQGGFIMDQVLSDDSPLAVTTDAILTADATRVRFPKDAAVLTQIEADIATYCWVDQKPSSDQGSDAYARTRFGSEAIYDQYIAAAVRRGPATNWSAVGRTTIFPTLRQFADTIDEALAALGTRTEREKQAHLNVYDFLSSYVEPCDPSDPSPPPVCVDEDAVRCGLALYQKAIVEGWVDKDDVEGASDMPTTGELDLFCPDTMSLEGCPDEASSNPGLFALQEHNRYWVDLAQILKLDADTARSDAFLVLFRNEVDPFAVGAALSYKADHLRFAVAQYDQVLRQIVGPSAAKVLFTWPARAFKQAGRDWLDMMQSVVSDRMDAIADLVDLERRVFMGTGDTDFAFAQHMMQNEYLVQVYLMTLQQKWQGELFTYLGEAGDVIETGQDVLNQLNPVKNALGVTPNQVFFENSNLTRANWLNYKDTLVGEDGDGGLVADARDQVADGVENLQNALFDLDALEESLYDSRRDLTEALNDICGDPDPFDADTPANDVCQQLYKQFRDEDEFEKVRDCKLAAYIEKLGSEATDLLGKDYAAPTDCPDDGVFEASITCLDHDAGLDKNACADVVTTFISNTEMIGADAAGDDMIATPPTCALTSDRPTIAVNGVARPCVGGEVGALLQEKAAVDLERRIVVGSVETLLKDISYVYELFDQVADEDSDLREELAGLTAGVHILSNIAGLMSLALDNASDASEIADCIVIAGFSVGTNCPGKAAGKLSTMAWQNIFGVIVMAIEEASAALETTMEFESYDHDVAVAGFEGAADLRSMVREIDGLIDEYNVLTQASFNLQAQIEDARFRARQAVLLYNQDVTFVAEHLLGRESGNRLLGQSQVQAASTTFREILRQTYRMTVAFVHHYNVTPGQAAVLIGRSQAPVTLDDVEGFIGDLEDYEAQYCGASGLDCDYVNNTETLRLSLRDTLFPNLRDIVDAHTGQVLTAGQQFHNLITRPPFLKRRIRASKPADQIEIPFAVPVQALTNTPDGDPRWLIDPLSCNQLIDARDPTDPTSPDMQDGSASQTGSVAVNILGDNVGDPSRVIRYQLVRGATDFIRACSPESVVGQVGTDPVVEYPIRKHVVGYAPQSEEGGKSNPASYYSVSQPFTACVNTAEVQGSLSTGLCWRYFARDRSLAAPDWKIVIPLTVGGAKTDSAWIAAEGLDSDEAPVIDDIVIYFRYRSRPIEED